MAEEFVLLQKVYDMMEYAYPAIAQFPKSEKYALGTDIKRCMDVMLEKCIEAQKKYYKKTTLQEFDVANTKLRAYLRISYSLGFLPPKNTRFGAASRWKLERCLAPGLKPSRARADIRSKLYRSFICGGNWNNSSRAGVFAVNCNNPRSNSNGNIGFRAACPRKSDIVSLPGHNQYKGYKGFASSASAGKHLAAYSAHAEKRSTGRI